jgi:hypothetical protein
VQSPSGGWGRKALRDAAAKVWLFAHYVCERCIASCAEFGFDTDIRSERPLKAESHRVQ